LRNLYQEGLLENFRFMSMHEVLRSFSSHQGKSERIKNFPYPRQYATINTLFVKLFCILLPFGLLGEFNKLTNQVDGILKGNMVWLVIPFSVLISWIYTSLEQVGESTENPFEGNANDVPISQMSRAVEIDIREMLGETELPSALHAKNDIVL
jgi:putative membrane protein